MLWARESAQKLRLAARAPEGVIVAGRPPRGPCRGRVLPQRELPEAAADLVPALADLAGEWRVASEGRPTQMRAARRASRCGGGAGRGAAGRRGSDAAGGRAVRAHAEQGAPAG